MCQLNSLEQENVFICCDICILHNLAPIQRRNCVCDKIAYCRHAVISRLLLQQEISKLKRKRVSLFNDRDVLKKILVLMQKSGIYYSIICASGILIETLFYLSDRNGSQVAVFWLQNHLRSMLENSTKRINAQRHQAPSPK